MGAEVEDGRAGRWRAAPWRRRAALLATCAVAAWTAPALAQVVEPEWWLAESPGTSGARFGLGLDYRFEDLDSLLAAALTQTVTLRDSRGNVSTEVIPGDPALNNRKFDYGFEVRSRGFQAPVALPHVRLGGGMTLFPSLVAEVATTEVTFAFDDRTVAGDGTSNSGSGVTWGLGLEGVAAIGREGRWFLGGGYRFRSLRDVDLHRSPSIDAFLDVTRDEVQLGQDTHLASLRLGRRFADGRLTPWVGARGRWTELEVDDELGFVSTDGIATGLHSRSRFESHSILAVAGVDAWLGRSMVGRAEVSLGDGDVAALLKVVYLVGSDASRPPPPGTIAAEFRRIRSEFIGAAEEIAPLETVDRTAYVAQALGLLARTEEKAVAVLERFDFIALADWIRARFDEAREALRHTGPGRTARPRFDSPRSTLVPAALRGPAGALPASAAESELSWIDRVLRALGLVIVRDDNDSMHVNVGFVVASEEIDVDQLRIVVYPASAPEREKRKPLLTETASEQFRLKIGDYTYCIKRTSKATSEEVPSGSPCGPEDGESEQFPFRCHSMRKPEGPHDQCPLDLASELVTCVRCELFASTSQNLPVCRQFDDIVADDCADVP